MSTTKYGFTKMSPDEFKIWIKKQGNYKYTGLQVHHTWSPNYSNFYKSNGTHEDELVRQNNIKSYHVNTNHWADIAQHFTIFPNGVIVTGRKLSNTCPVGIRGWNSNKICIEIYGNFDKGKDVMTKEQKDAVIVVYGELCKKFNIIPSTSTIRCHAWFTAGGTYLGDYNPNRSAKTCPGTNFMGFGNSLKAIRDNFMPLIKNYIANGNTVTIEQPNQNEFKPYLARCTTDNLNCRKGAGTNFEVERQINKGVVITIVEEKMNGNTKWGLAKSGYWVSLKYMSFIRYI